MTKQIPLTQNKFALVDDSDYDELSKYKWCAIRRKNKFYAKRAAGIKDGKLVTEYMHKRLMPKKNTQVDHINGNSLDNQKHNLRYSTQHQNNMNASLRCDSTTGYKGVVIIRNKFRARIRFNKIDRHIGYFTNPIDAAKAYDIKAKELFGEFAHLNFP